MRLGDKFLIVVQGGRNGEYRKTKGGLQPRAMLIADWRF